MKSLILSLTALSLLAGAHAQSGRLIGPFNLGSGSWTTVPFGGFDTNLNGWGGVGATSLMYIAHGASPTDAAQLPYAPTTGVLRYGYTVNFNQPPTVWGGWLAGSIPQNVIGQSYVLSAFINVKGRPLIWPSESHRIAVDKGNYNYVSTPGVLGGHHGWQFVYVQYTATGYPGGSFPIMVINNFVQALAGQEVEYDEIAVTPAHLFAPPTVTGSGSTRVQGRVVLNGVQGPRPRTAMVEMLQSPSGMRLSSVVDLDANGNFSFDVGRYGTATFSLRVKPDTGLALRTAGVFTLDGATVSFPNLLCVNGDADGNNQIGPNDFTVVLNSFGREAGDPGFNPAADLDGNNEVGPADFTIVLDNFGEEGD